MKAQLPPKKSGRPRQHYAALLALKPGQCTGLLPASVAGSAQYWSEKLKRKFLCRQETPGIVRVWRAE